jgi:two-component system chemotaxis response regulator CheB
MGKIRVLVVDDSTVIRRLLANALSGEPDIEVVGSAPNGRLALAKIPQLNPDIVTLDIEMPELDGLATLPLLRKTYPKLPVIMFSTLTEKGAVATLNALSLGASDYVTKPANIGSVTAGIQKVKSDLIPKIKALCWRADAPAPRRAPTPAKAGAAAPLRAVGPRAAMGVLAIGVSTGGPNALMEIFKLLPGDFPVPIVIVQHMPPIFTKYLAERLNAVGKLRVVEARAGEVLRPGCAWLAPGDFHLALTRSTAGSLTKLHQGPPENSCRPAVDVLFRSVAEIYGPAALGLVLTGMGYDGLRGAEAIRHAGGHILAQDEASSVVWGMPGAVAQAGLANEVLPLDEIAHRLIALAGWSPTASGVAISTARFAPLVAQR